jgi:pentatricopeptide repeat protein
LQLRSVLQGESEGMIPDKRLYEAIIKTHARRGQISEALRRLQEMRLKHLIPDKDHFSALVTANALAGSLQG